MLFGNGPAFALITVISNANRNYFVFILLLPGSVVVSVRSDGWSVEKARALAYGKPLVNNKPLLGWKKNKTQEKPHIALHPDDHRGNPLNR